MSLEAELERPAAKLNQVEIDHIELGTTSVTPMAARLFSWVFVSMLFAVPVFQAIIELRKGQLPYALEVFGPGVTGLKHVAKGRWDDALNTWRRGIAPETLHAYESGLENSSAPKNFFQPRVQELLTKYLGAGNHKVVTGSQGWLFYQPGVAYVTRPNMIAPVVLESAAKKMVDKDLETSPSPDPRPAIVKLHQDTQRAGIHLIVFPAPGKAMMQPVQLTGRAARPDPISVPNNAGYNQLVGELKAQGVDWFDALPASVSSGELRYLEQDTHWTPEFMSRVAQQLAAHIRRSGVSSDSPGVAMHLRDVQVSRVGDLVDMLKLPSTQSIFKPQTVTIQQVIEDSTGNPVEPDSSSDVLVVGDSFTNIYSQPQMGWGAGAGFAEHLAFHLGRRVDVIAFNGGGASQVRSSLARQENAERLGTKKILVYEFAVRNLLGENWKPYPLVTPVRPSPPVVQPSSQREIEVRRVEPPAKAPSLPRSEPAPAIPSVPATTPAPAIAAQPQGPLPGEIVLTGRITQTSNVPTPGSAPYKDCLTFIKIAVESVESGAYEEREAVVVFLAMKNDEWLAPARYSTGQRFRLKLVPLSRAPRQIRSVQRADDLNDYSHQPLFSLMETPL